MNQAHPSPGHPSPVNPLVDHGKRFSREEVDEAFAHFYLTGCVEEDWTSWARLFTDDACYVERFWGNMTGRRQIEAWINPVMAGVPEIYTILEWYMVDETGRVVWYLQNRRDNPDPDGPPYFDFAGISTARYAGDGLFDYEEDYWDVKGARATAGEYAAACEKMGTTYEQKLSRRFWPAGPSWARLDTTVAVPNWLGLTDIRRITKPWELREILAALD
jgi:hypothetical protein